VDTKGFVARDEAGTIVAVMGLFRDLSEQYRQEEERAALQQQVIDAQRQALRELSTPLIPISDNVLIMPLIGTIDSQRAQQVMEALLEGVAQHQADLVVLDITGVAVVDTQVAQSFIQAAQAVRLLGAQVMLTGIQPQIAQTLVHLGVDLSGIQTQGSLQAGIASALRQ
jgi:anti-anti-sigma factor